MYIILVTLLVAAILFGTGTSVYLIRKLMSELGDEPSTARKLATLVPVPNKIAATKSVTRMM